MLKPTCPEPVAGSERSHACPHAGSGEEPPALRPKRPSSNEDAARPKIKANRFQIPRAYTHIALLAKFKYCFKNIG